MEPLHSPVHVGYASLGSQQRFPEMKKDMCQLMIKKETIMFYVN